LIGPSVKLTEAPEMDFSNLLDWDWLSGNLTSFGAADSLPLAGIVSQGQLSTMDVGPNAGQTVQEIRQGV